MSNNLFSLYGFYEWDHSIFDGIVLPAGMDKDVLINVIMDFSGELKPYHQVPSRLKYSITNFFKRRYSQYARMYEALITQYNALENYDRIENTRDDNTSKSHSSSKSSSRGSVSAFNSSSFEPNNMTSGDGSSDANGEGHITHTSHVHGNIGVTTSAQMLRGELEIRTYDIYKTIAMEFERELLIQIY